MNPAERDLATILASAPDFARRPFTVALAVPPVASPMQRGIDGHGWRVESGPDAYFVKVPAEDGRLFVDSAAAVEAARVAGALGVAPPLLWSHPASGTAMWPFLDGSWRTATLADIETRAVCDPLIATLHRLHRGPRLARTRSVFDLVEAYAAEAAARCLGLPHDYAWMLDNVRDIAAAILAAGFDTVPCHGDGIASNVMVGSSNAILLVDWDEAANADPFWDLGSLFAEAFGFDAPAREALELYAGRCDETLLNRCRLYGIADDLAWATRSMIVATLTDRVDVEFFKYAQWRFLRCRMNLGDRRFEERLRRL